MQDEELDLLGFGAIDEQGSVYSEGSCEVVTDPKVPGKYVVRTQPGAKVEVQLKDPNARVLSQRATSKPGEHVVRIVSARSPSEPFASPLEIAVLRQS